MLIGIIGESCVGKSTLAEELRQRLHAEVFTGKDYLRLAKNETAAKKLFQKKLEDACAGAHIIYVISEKEHLELLPANAIRVLMTADMDRILDRFAQRMRGNLPEPVRQMLVKKRSIFDGVDRFVHIHNNAGIDAACDRIMEAAQ